MLDAKAIDTLDCKAVSRDPRKRREILLAVRALFYRRYRDFDHTMDDATLVRFSKAKYYDRKFDAAATSPAADTEYFQLHYLYHVPDHLCSWYRVALRERYLVAA